MNAHILEISGAWLERGYWLYVWEVRVPRRKHPLHYVGRTGDSSSLFAASPFNRMGQHLDLRKSASAAMLAKNLERVGVHRSKLPSCSFRLLALGPLFPEGKVSDHNNPTKAESDSHRLYRDKIAAAERDLAQALRLAGYHVINTVLCQKPQDKKLWKQVLAGFEKHFPKIGI